jgi:hypothetical protein
MLLSKAKLPEDCHGITDRINIIVNLCEACKELKENQANHVELRESYLSSLAMALILHSNPDIADKGKHQFERRKARQKKCIKEKGIPKKNVSKN